MNQIQVVILTGKAQSGKDTSYCCLEQELLGKYSINSKSIALADPLKEFLMEVFGLSLEQCYGTNDDKNSPTRVSWDNLPLPQEKIWELRSSEERLTARQLMQIFGSDVCRRMYGDCWVWATATRIARMAEEGIYDTVFITDARFPNEIDFFEALPEEFYDAIKPKPVVVRLIRNPLQSNHISETALDNYRWDKLAKFIRVPNATWSMETKEEYLREKVAPFIVSEMRQ